MKRPHTTQAKVTKNQQQFLGSKIASYPVLNQNLCRVIGISLGVMLILVSISFSTLRFSEMAVGVTRHGRASVLLYTPSLILLLAILPLGGVILVLTAINWDNQLIIFERGLILRHGLKEKVWRWHFTTRLDTRVTHIKFGASIIDIRIRILVGNDRETLLIQNKYEKMSDLVQKIRASVLPILTEWAENQFNLNKPIVFHEALVGTREGLKIRGEQTGWGQIESPKIKKHKLILYRSPEQKKLFQGNLNQITNLDLLIHILNNP